MWRMDKLGPGIVCIEASSGDKDNNKKLLSESYLIENCERFPIF